MKTAKQTLIIIIALLLSIKCYAQFGEFSTPEGFKWGMTQNEVLRLNFGQPIIQNNDEISYYDAKTTNSLIYKFSEGKLNQITKKYGYQSEYDMNIYFDIYKKQFINRYGINYTEIPDKNTFLWVYKSTRILLFKSTTNNEPKIFINYKQS